MTTETPALSIEKLKRHFLECTICKEQYDDEEKHPRVLPCLHSFCYSCLKRLIEQTKYTCPLCKSDFKTVNITADLFPKDNTRRDLLDFIHAADENTFLPCDECDENEKSVARCKDCFKFLGENCLKAHKSMKTFAKHRVFTLLDVTFDVNSISDFRSAGICSNHDEVLKLYCAGKECQAPICHSCCLTSHMDDKNHVRRNIDEIYSEKKDNLLQKEIKLTDMANELDQLSSKVVQTVDYLDENSKEVENEITAIFHIAIEMLQRRRNYLLEEVKGIKKDKEIVLQKQKEEICFLRQSIIDACEFLNQSLASKNQAAFLILSNTIAERFDYLLKTDFNKVPHDINVINFRKCNLGAYFQLIVNMLGCVASTTAYGPNTVVNIPRTVEQDEVFDLKIDFYDFTNSQIPEKIIATYTLYDDKDEVITDCEEKLMIEDGGGKYKTSCTIGDKTKSISRICIKVNGNDFHCIKLDTTVENGEENCTNVTEINVSEQDMDTAISDHGKEYTVTDDRTEDNSTEHETKTILTDHAQNDSASEDGKDCWTRGYTKGDTDSENGKADTISDEDASLDSTSEDELLEFTKIVKIVTMQMNNEEKFKTDTDTAFEDFFDDDPDESQLCGDVFIDRGRIYRLSLYIDHTFTNKYDLLPETELFAIFRLNEKRYLFNVEVERYDDYISRITIMNCNECKQVCINMISEDLQNINHQTVSLPIVVYMNRQKNFIACFQGKDGCADMSLICLTSIKADGVYTCTVKCE